MRWFGVLPVALLLPAVIGCGPREDEGFRLIHIADLVAMRTAAETPVMVVDANGPDFRAREGTIPGAILLSSYSKYDTGEELPASKDARLVFYCADPH